ncbi:hypothetical protein POM88_016872 [Heracleum sosnowskyi]|uniref:Transposase MuDR plant domain-containing protein n=1 Tax=Heracleum sosnowskyi TaxID=360622 RepID=A0AAD8IPE4_9APIA|nr:hypothetical protein POM88_016872 [Heracleum sosnowskyi]
MIYTENDSDHDPDYLIETESSDDDCSSLDNSDEELNEYRQSRKLFKEQLTSEKFRDVSSHESSFESDELRSVHSSSEDEISRKGFIGDNLVKNKRKSREKLFKEAPGKVGTIKFEVGLRFLSMDEFRTTVRQYGLDERRALYFAKNDSQSVCGATGHRKNKCPTPQEEFSKGKEKSKETTTTETTIENTTDKPKRTYKPKRKACIPWRTKNTSSQAFELKRTPSQRKKLETRRKPALSIREEDEEYLDQDF